MKGKLIVFEGGDGSGKTIQAKMLVEYFRKNNLQAEYYDFPQYYSSFHGETVAKFLRGEFGDIEEVSPYLASIPFALDRASVKDKMKATLSNGTHIIANRYATSNLIYQAAKFASDREKENFINWISKFEYEVNSIPREDIVIYLNVPSNIGSQLTKQKGPRKYLKGNNDIHEHHHEYRQKVEKLYLDFCKNNKSWYSISCFENGKLLSVDDIHDKIIRKLKEIKVV